MRSLTIYILALTALWGGIPAPIGAQECKIVRIHHPWGRCPSGAWKIVRVVTETLDEQGAIASRSITETKTTLADVDDAGVTLEVRTIVELSGRKFESEPQIIKQGFHGELVCPSLKIQDEGAGSVTIENHAIPCRIYRMESIVGNAKTVTRLYFSETFSPYILKRESVTTDLPGKTTLSETAVEVVALNMPCEVGAEMRRGTQVKTVHKHPNGTISTLAFISPDVPGGVICHQSRETDKSGKAVRNSTLKVVSYGFDPDSERTGLFVRKRPSRFRKPTNAFSPDRP